MKKILVAILSVIMLLGFTTNTNVLAANEKILVNVDGKSVNLDKIKVNLDGKELQTDVPAIKYEGNTLIPVRALAEKLGAEINWDEENRIATIKTSEKTIELGENSSKAIVNGKEVIIDNNAAIKLVSTSSSDKARTMAPLRFISETLGSKVEWVRETKTANITSAKAEEPQVPEQPQEPQKPEEIQANKIKTITTKNIDNSTVPQIHIEAEKELSYKTMYLNNSTRLVIDIDNAIIEKSIDLNVNNSVVSTINAVQHTNTNDSKSVRITIEFKKAVNHDLIKSNNKLIIDFTNDLLGVEKQIIDGKEAIVIKNAYSSKTNSFTLSNPHRIVVDLRNTNLNNVGTQISTDLVKSVRLGQFTGGDYDPSEKVARVVLDISENYDNPKFTTQERGDDLIIIVEGTKKAPVVTPPVSPTPPTTPPANGPQKTIVVDAGHGGHDGGAAANGIREKDVALSVSLKLQTKLEALGYRVLMTRTTDTYPSLSDRYKLANNNNADAFISVHFNAAGSTATGIETLHSSKNSQNKAFAQSIQNELIKETGARDRGLKPRNDLAVLNGTKGISALAELGFITNPTDAKVIKTDAYLENCATAIANGIHRFFTS